MAGGKVRRRRRIVAADTPWCHPERSGRGSPKRALGVRGVSGVESRRDATKWRGLAAGFVRQSYLFALVRPRLRRTPCSTTGVTERMGFLALWVCLLPISLAPYRPSLRVTRILGVSLRTGAGALFPPHGVADSPGGKVRRRSFATHGYLQKNELPLRSVK